jgi:group I intron endonuclease
MKYIVYKTTNLINNKIYIGKHQTENINDTYLGSGVALENAIKRYGKQNFKKEILFIFNTEKEMNEKEKELVTETFIATNKTYNMGVGGEGGSHFKGKTHSLETKQKLSKIAKDRKLSDETRRKISEANRKRVLSDETKKKLSEKAKLRFQNEEARKKHSELMKEFYKK